MSVDKSTGASRRSPHTRSARVIPFPVRTRDAAEPKRSDGPVITQGRLERGAKLMAQERELIQTVRQFVLDLQADLAAGAATEAGELFFDRELGLIRRQHQRSGPESGAPRAFPLARA